MIVSALFARAKHATETAAKIAENKDDRPPWVLIRELATLVGSVAEMVMDVERERMPSSEPPPIVQCANPGCGVRFIGSCTECPTCGQREWFVI